MQSRIRINAKTVALFLLFALVVLYSSASASQIAALAAAQTITFTAPETAEVFTSIQLTATVTPAEAGDTVMWSSSNKKLATVDADGLVTFGSRTGKVTITARCGKAKASRTIKVIDPYLPTGVEIYCDGTVQRPKSTITLYVGNTYTISAGVQPDTARAEYSWKVIGNAKNYIAFDDATRIVTPLEEGSVKLQVRAVRGRFNKSTYIRIKVIDPKKPKGIVMTPSGTQTLVVGKTLQLGFTLVPETAEGGVTWKSSSPKYATVDENGLVTAVKAGRTVTITATCKKNSKVKGTVKIKTVMAKKELGDLLNMPVGVALARYPEFRFMPDGYYGGGYHEDEPYWTYCDTCNNQPSAFLDVDRLDGTIKLIKITEARTSPYTLFGIQLGMNKRSLIDCLNAIPAIEYDPDDLPQYSTLDAILCQVEAVSKSHFTVE